MVALDTPEDEPSPFGRTSGALTAGYTASQFERSPIEVVGDPTEAPVDTDGDGGYDHLEVVVPIDIQYADTYSFRLMLTTPDGQTLTEVGFGPFQLDPGQYPVSFELSGDDIRAAGIDGPYVVRNLLVQGGAYGASLIVGDVLTTQPYLHTQFGPPAQVAIVIDGRLGFRYLGAPAEGVTLDDLADMNLVRGVPGYYPNARAPNIWTAYDPVAVEWIPSLGTGEVLQLGHGFRWQMYDMNQGNPNVSLGYEFPVTIATTLPANTADVDVTLDTGGARFNFLANPFGETLDLTDVYNWPGGDNVSPNAPLWIYDPETRTWVEDPVSAAPWMAFRAKVKGPRINGNPRILTIPASAIQPASAARAAPSPGLAFSLSGTDAEGAPIADRALSIRFSDDASAGFDAEEDTEKFQVPAVAYAQIGARTDGVWMGHDVRPFADAEIPLAIEARGTGSRFTLAWDAGALPAGLPVVLVDLETGTETDVRAQSSLTFEAAPQPAHDEAPLNDLSDGADATDRFVLRIGTVAAAEAEVTEVELTAIAPNPSAGTARVAFGIPEAGTARVAVYDVRGREVAVLVDRPMAAGRHEATLDSGSLAAGVYLVRLEAGGAVVTRQAVVVR